jgi:hypothetical protein
MKTKGKQLLGISVLLFVMQQAWAGELAIPNTFQANTPAVAAQVNANFGAVETAVDDNNTRITANTTNINTHSSDIAALQATVADLQSQLATANNAIFTLQNALRSKADVFHNHDGVYAPIVHTHAQADITDLTNDLATHSSQISAINNSQVMALEPYLTVASDSRGPIATFRAINLQLVNGRGTTGSAVLGEGPNGLGNLIIGYDEPRDDGTFFCSIGAFTDQANCESRGYTWAVSHKSGSHYLVIGAQNNYSRYGGLVTGFQNTSNKAYANVLGGSNNTARGGYATVSGGYLNTASGSNTSISGGNNNTTSGQYSSISGGEYNTASGDYSSVSGGEYNTASGDYSSVSGGEYNAASGQYSSVSGGGSNTAGGGNTASHDYSSILGGLNQDSTSNNQTIPALP